MSRLTAAALAAAGSAQAWWIGDAERPWSGFANLYRAYREEA